MKLTNKLLFSILLLIIIILFFLWYEKRTHIDSEPELHELIAHILIKEGINDSDILTEKKIHHKNGDRWIQVVREIKIRDEFDIKELINKIKQQISQIEAGIYLIEHKKNLVKYEIKKYKKIFEKLTFYLPHKIKIAVVIDDLGYNMGMVEEFLKLNIPITFTILPDERYSLEIAEKLANMNYHYLLHLPLESEMYDGAIPARTMILTDMSQTEIQEKFYYNLNSIRIKHKNGSFYPVGVNNHTGSKFTADYDKMKILLNLVKEKKLFFFDSFTTPKSVVKKVARELGVPCLRNNIFLDTAKDEDKIERKFERLLKLAQKRGYGVGIGHIYNRETLEVLKRIKPKFRKQGCEFVFLEQLLIEQ